jgi:hypothetical protein
MSEEPLNPPKNSCSHTPLCLLFAFLCEQQNHGYRTQYDVPLFPKWEETALQTNDK